MHDLLCKKWVVYRNDPDALTDRVSKHKLTLNAKRVLTLQPAEFDCVPSNKNMKKSKLCCRSRRKLSNASSVLWVVAKLGAPPR